VGAEKDRPSNNGATEGEGGKGCGKKRREESINSWVGKSWNWWQKDSKKTKRNRPKKTPDVQMVCEKKEQENRPRTGLPLKKLRVGRQISAVRRKKKVNWVGGKKRAERNTIGGWITREK